MSQYFRDRVNTIIHGNSLDVLKNFPYHCIDLVLTDPPYGISNKEGGRMTFSDGKPDWMVDKTGGEFDDQQTDENMYKLYEDLATLLNVVLKEEGSILIFFDRSKPYLLEPMFKKFRIRNTIIFVKSNPPPHMFKNNYRSGYETCGWFTRDDYKINFLGQSKMINVFYGMIGKHYTAHPTEKYEWMIKPLIERHSDPGDLILDPFVGSGRFCVEAKKLDRRYIGIDIEQKWCDVASKWLEGTSLSPLVTMTDARKLFE